MMLMYMLANSRWFICKRRKGGFVCFNAMMIYRNAIVGIVGMWCEGVIRYVQRAHDGGSGRSAVCAWVPRCRNQRQGQRQRQV